MLISAALSLTLCAVAQNPATPPTPAPGRQSQTLGPWEVVPPGSAVVVNGGGGLWGWINVVNSSLSFTQAMIQSPIEDAGFVNADIGTTLDFVHVPGVVNGPGADLVLFDAQFDTGQYRVSTNYDGFTASILADTLFGTYATTRPYYYEFGSAVPVNADVVGMEIDLTDLGVPDGEIVIGFRLVCENPGCDPISLAKIDRFALGVPQLQAGTSATLELSGATKSGTVGIGFSLTGTGPTTVNAGPCGNISVDLSAPVQVLAVNSADSSGNFYYTGNVPPTASGATVHLQALDLSTCALSNVVSRTIL